ncbi:hypothetical protein Cni_G16029 [Canna indica]|uniref:Leucine-rich repeat-containing N-terminal plant-type domain-containing protein n=1 Tax=Canna indica TaxID=4628 RepID=A0AAQ3QDV7_9LILI|nr:hypothetical protein Cni_G16029 [Canna indica]
MDDILKRASSVSPSYHILSLLFIFFVKTDASTCASNDLRALQDFSISLNTTILEWPTSIANSSSCCSWPGVQCDSTLNSSMPSAARVVGLNLSGKGLEGVLSSFISGLNKLSYLNLSNNSFRGRIPKELFHLKPLEVLDRQNNQLSGELAPNIRNLSNLRHLDLSNNWFTGTIPDVFQALRKLKVFAAGSNAFVGELPTSLSSCSELTMLSLWNNSLDGNIDNLNFSRLACLSSLDLGWNNLQGHIPETLSACKELKTLNLSYNKIRGHVPEKFCNLGALNYLDLSTNSLSNISESLKVLQKCDNLTIMYLGGNFEGEEVPTDGIQGFPKLWDIHLADCGLAGQIPSWFGDFDHIFILNLSNNLLSGEIPVSLAQLRGPTSGITLEDKYDSCCLSMSFYWNDDRTDAGRPYKLYMNVPVALNFSSNKFNGTIWKDFGNLKHLQWIDLSRIYLSGSIPDELSDMSSMEKLDLSFNNLSGRIPSSVIRLSFMSFFSVAYNHLEDPVPIEGQFLSFPYSKFEGNPGLYRTSVYP